MSELLLKLLLWWLLSVWMALQLLPEAILALGAEVIAAVAMEVARLLLVAGMVVVLCVLFAVWVLSCWMAHK